VRRIRWTAEASEQFAGAVEHILAENPAAARKTAQTVLDRIEQLAAFPALGRRGEVEGTRELVNPPYVIVYRFTDEVVEVLQVWHGAQDWR
jgi:plasmid stabilization system protein ParE